MAPQYFVQGIFATAGLIALLASILNWNWFFTTRNAQTIVRNVAAAEHGSFTAYWESL